MIYKLCYTTAILSYYAVQSVGGSPATTWLFNTAVQSVQLRPLLSRWF